MAAVSQYPPVAEFDSMEPQAPFPLKVFDVTDIGAQVCHVLCCPLTWMAIFPGVLGKKTFTLEAEEAIYEWKCCLYNGTTRRPYGELGSVDSGNCCCCVGVASDLTKGQPLCVGWGCDKPRVDEIVRELKLRMKTRGDTGQIRRQEALSARFAVMEAKIDAIMSHLSVEMPQVQKTTMR